MVNRQMNPPENYGSSPKKRSNLGLFFCLFTHKWQVDSAQLHLAAAESTLTQVGW